MVSVVLLYSCCCFLWYACYICLLILQSFCTMSWAILLRSDYLYCIDLSALSCSSKLLLFGAIFRRTPLVVFAGFFHRSLSASAHWAHLFRTFVRIGNAGRYRILNSSAFQMERRTTGKLQPENLWNHCLCSKVCTLISRLVSQIRWRQKRSIRTFQLLVLPAAGCDLPPAGCNLHRWVAIWHARASAGVSQTRLHIWYSTCLNIAQ